MGVGGLPFVRTRKPGTECMQVRLHPSWLTPLQLTAQGAHTWHQSVSDDVIRFVCAPPPARAAGRSAHGLQAERKVPGGPQ